ncbi:unnamed protein product, partial [Prunus brigantina]
LLSLPRAPLPDYCSSEQNNPHHRHLRPPRLTAPVPNEPGHSRLPSPTGPSHRHRRYCPEFAENEAGFDRTSHRSISLLRPPIPTGENRCSSRSCTAGGTLSGSGSLGLFPVVAPGSVQVVFEA